MAMNRLHVLALAALFSGTALAQTTSSTGIPMYSSGYMTLPYGNSPGLSDGVSVLGMGVNHSVFSVLNASEGGIASLSSIPQLGGSNGPESFVTRLDGMYVLNDNTSIVGGLTYFQGGNVELRDLEGNELGVFTPSETLFQAGVVQRFTEKFKGGVKLGYGSTNLGASSQNTNITERALTVGFSLDYSAEVADGELVSYWALNHIGKKNNFSESNLNYLPTQMQMGVNWVKDLGDNIKLAPGLNLQKYLVPTSPLLNADGTIQAGKPQSMSLFGAMFGSFNDAPGGSSEELQEWRMLIALETIVRDRFYVGVSASFESTDKGNRQFVNFGAGLKTEKIQLGLGYFLPIAQQAAYYSGSTGLGLSISF